MRHIWWMNSWRGALAAAVFCSSCTPAVNDGDGGVLDDAGDVEDDAGFNDDAGFVEDDAGPGDAGIDPCADADPTLGTLTLAAGFSIVDSSAVPGEAIAVTAVAQGESYRVYAVDVVDVSVLDLGVWPSLDTATTLFEIVPDDGTVDTAYASPFLAHTGSRLAAGYTAPFNDLGVAPGHVAIFDTAAVSDALAHVPSDNNYSAAFADDVLVVNATSLGGVGTETAIYGWATEAGVLATFPDPAMTYGAPVAATAQGGVVVSGYYADTGAQHFFLLSAASAAAALAGQPVALADEDEITAVPSLYAASFGEYLAYVHGDYTAVEAVRRVPLADGADRTAEDVLVIQDGCTSVTMLADMGDDLLVGLSDSAGSRLIRVRQDG